MRWQKLEGRIVTHKAELERHQKLIAQIESIIERARDSTLMDAEYDAWQIEDLFKCEPIRVKLPPNEWEQLPQQGANPDRKLCVGLYIDRAKYEYQGLALEPKGGREG